MISVIVTCFYTKVLGRIYTKWDKIKPHQKIYIYTKFLLFTLYSCSISLRVSVFKGMLRLTLWVSLKNLYNCIMKQCFTATNELFYQCEQTQRLFQLCIISPFLYLYFTYVDFTFITVFLHNCFTFSYEWG